MSTFMDFFQKEPLDIKREDLLAEALRKAVDIDLDTMLKLLKSYIFDTGRLKALISLLPLFVQYQDDVSLAEILSSFRHDVQKVKAFDLIVDRVRSDTPFNAIVYMMTTSSDSSKIHIVRSLSDNVPSSHTVAPYMNCLNHDEGKLGVYRMLERLVSVRNPEKIWEEVHEPILNALNEYDNRKTILYELDRFGYRPTLTQLKSVLCVKKMFIEASERYKYTKNEISPFLEEFEDKEETKADDGQDERKTILEGI